MDSKQIKFLTIAISLLLLFVSLTQDAIVVNYSGEVRNDSALGYFLIGAIAFLGGGLFEEIIWLANPLCLLAIIYFLKNNEKAVLLSLIASGLAISFAFWSEILGAESGAMAKIVSFGLGYYLWASSILVLTTGILLNYKMSLKESLQS
ncbi:hypothetical protein [Flavobacterium sp. IB48]|uniref:hypothetical protein n=1 Tax=Flavobacterium sp. IB48 TaxID=2779375 RepID=UPI0018E6ED4E|nr:hypothetical protein [Flavobacterium sp. IB48]MBJ2123963.1 hypothetical protein [Flavobacterium sp. IB48]